MMKERIAAWSGLNVTGRGRRRSRSRGRPVRHSPILRSDPRHRRQELHEAGEVVDAAPAGARIALVLEVGIGSHTRMRSAETPTASSIGKRSFVMPISLR